MLSDVTCVSPLPCSAPLAPGRRAVESELRAGDRQSPGCFPSFTMQRCHWPVWEASGRESLLKTWVLKSPTSPNSESVCLGPELSVFTIPHSDSAAGDRLRNRVCQAGLQASRSDQNPFSTLRTFTICPSSSASGSRASSFNPLGLLMRLVAWMSHAC